MAPLRRRAAATALLALTLCGAPSAAQPRYRGRVRPLDAPTRASMIGPAGSWRPGCPVELADLRVLELDHWGFDGAVHTGRLVVHRAHARALVGVFGTLFAARFAIERMEPVDRYGADDHRSMSANNTSAFNCREVAGRPGVWSQHAYGLAIDLNPVQNPYVSAPARRPRRARPSSSVDPRAASSRTTAPSCAPSPAPAGRGADTGAATGTTSTSPPTAADASRGDAGGGVRGRGRRAPGAVVEVDSSAGAV